MALKSIFADAFLAYASEGNLLRDPVIDDGSLASCSLTMLFGETVIAKGTGFFWRRPDCIALVTAWHNLAGLHHTKRTCLHSKGAVPDRLKYRFMATEPKGFHEYEVPLYLDDNREKPQWYVHPRVGSYFDIAWIGINFDKPIGIKFVNEKYPPVSEYVPVGSEVFSVGFPQGIGLMGIFPVWKRGSLATEMALPTDAHPKFLIDMTGRKGMSGSPVYRSQKGTIISGQDGTRNFGFGIKREFIGLYSGRASDATLGHESSELGFVWRYDIVQEVTGSSILDEKPEVGKGALEIRENFSMPTR